MQGLRVQDGLTVGRVLEPEKRGSESAYVCSGGQVPNVPIVGDAHTGGRLAWI